MGSDALEVVFERVRSWPQPRRDDVLQLLLSVEAQGEAPYILSEEESSDLAQALKDVASGEIATPEQVRHVFNNFRE